MAKRDPMVEDLAQVLLDQNPWQHPSGPGEGVPEALAPKTERPLARALWRKVLSDSPRRFQLILGPRRVGKTTAMYQTVGHLLNEGIPPKRLWWLRLDHPLLMSDHLGSLLRPILERVGATHDAPVFVFLDEIVYSKDWDLWLKTFFDEHYPVRIVSTSSATAALRRRRTESGVGRWEEQFLMPYLFSESLELSGRQRRDVGRTLAETMRNVGDVASDAETLAARTMFTLIGGFPELLLSQLELAKAHNHAIPPMTDGMLSSQEMLRSDAVERAVYKDIPQSFGVDRPMTLERMLLVLAGQVTGVLAPASICRDLGISQPTFERYLSYLENAFLVFTLPNYAGAESAIQRRGRKVYFVDGAVRNAALQRGLRPLRDPAEMGILIENLVASQLHVLAQHTDVRLYHWREGDREVDLIFDHPDEPLAFEVTGSLTHSAQGLQALIRRHPRFQDRCYLVGPARSFRLPNADPNGIGSMSLDAFLIAVGSQAEEAIESRLVGHPHTLPPS